MVPAAQALFAILRSAVCGAEKPVLSEPERRAALALAQRHGLRTLAAAADSAACLRSEAVETAIWYSFRQDSAAERMFAALEGAHIAYVPLKGLVLRAYYPEPWMRSLTDLDILVAPQERTRACRALQEAGFAFRGTGKHESSLTFDGIEAEVHHALILPQEFPRAAAVLRTVWARVSREPSGRCTLAEPDFYLYHIAHMMKHLQNGGCGIRFFLDLYLINRRPEHDAATCHAAVERCGMLPFALAAERLAEAWMTGGDVPEELFPFAETVVGGKLFATPAATALAWRSKSGSRGAYLLARAFSSAERENPYVKAHPWLLPLVWLRRFLRLLDPKTRRRIRTELRAERRTAPDKLAGFESLAVLLGFPGAEAPISSSFSEELS